MADGHGRMPTKWAKPRAKDSVITYYLTVNLLPTVIKFIFQELIQSNQTIFQSLSNAKFCEDWRKVVLITLITFRTVTHRSVLIHLAFIHLFLANYLDYHAEKMQQTICCLTLVAIVLLPFGFELCLKTYRRWRLLWTSSLVSTL